MPAGGEEILTTSKEDEGHAELQRKILPADPDGDFRPGLKFWTMIHQWCAYGNESTSFLPGYSPL